MNTEEILLVGLLGAANLILGIGLASVLSARLSDFSAPQLSRRKAFFLLLGVYFCECVAFAAGMATQVFTIGLAFIWGFALGRWLRRQAPIPALKFSSGLALYSCLPTITFGTIVPLAWTLAGNDPFNIEAGHQFGVPDFIPGPLGTVAGFAIALMAGTVVLKWVITVGEVSLLLHYAHQGENPA